VQIGVFCDSPEDGAAYSYEDFYYECGLGDAYTFQSQRYVCFDSVVHPGGSEVFFIGQVEMVSDFRWSNVEVDYCFTFTAAGDSPTPSPQGGTLFSPTTSPGSVGTDGTPSSSPTESPRRGIPNASGSDGGISSNPGLIVGALAGVLLLIGIGVGIFYCLRTKKNSGDAATNVYPGATPAAADKPASASYPVAGVPAPAPYLMAAVLPPDEPVMAEVFDPQASAIPGKPVAASAGASVEPEYSYAVDL
jgi:hypothetical protein